MTCAYERSVSRQVPPWPYADLLEQVDQTLGTITHALIKQPQALADDEFPNRDSFQNRRVVCKSNPEEIKQRVYNF